MIPSPAPPVADATFLGASLPWAKVAAFLLLLPSVATLPLLSTGGGAALLLTTLAVGAAGLSWRELLPPLRRLRWFYLFLFLLHGLLTPGHPIAPWLPFVIREGVGVGLEQGVRLTLLAVLAWVLMRSTPPLHVAAALNTLLGWLEPLGVPVSRAVALLAYALAALGHLHAAALGVGRMQSLRLGTGEGKGAARLARLAQGGEILLLRTLEEVRGQERAMRARGFDGELPVLVTSRRRPGWRDGVILTAPLLPMLLSMGGQS